MKFKKINFGHIDDMIIAWMDRWGVTLLRYSLAIVFIWFGILKPFGLSSATDMVAKTVYWVDPAWFIPFLGWWEVVIGVCLLYKPMVRAGIFLMALQMAGTFLPMILLPDVVYVQFPFVLTLEGQYIVKNIVLISAAIVVGSKVKEK
ncbi:TPA: hypothetical protein HA239_05090 [Candidatus Woesearchaeota archaeon]|nr:hypothetical protein QT06_C0001G0322 [archaeon GW2011_AR15]MBS3103640.1 hypothetical protein [Candidatus Woesearchaeota archaeon]HIH41759.1 hypothetical protein [Candidatus Woesearchaeota archaeon]